MTLLDELKADNWFNDASNEQLEGLKKCIENELYTRHEKAVDEAINKLKEAWFNLHDLGIAIVSQHTLTGGTDIDWEELKFFEY